MTMTLRTSDDDEQTIARLQQRWGLSKHATILRALKVADEGSSLEDDAMEAYEDVVSEYREALDRLGTV